MKKQTHISTRIHYKNPWWEYRIDEFSLPDGKTGEYNYVHTGGSTFVIPITSNNQIIMIEQHRYLNDKNSIEFPGGGLENGISEKENALKELREETGYKAARIEKIGEFNPFNGVTNEISHLFFAQELTLGETDFDETEMIEKHYFCVQDVIEMIKSNRIWDGMTLAAWALFEKSKYFEELK